MLETVPIKNPPGSPGRFLIAFWHYQKKKFSSVKSL